MNFDLKFNGKFTDLKKQGYEFLKLYANNYKVYRKKLDRSFSIWVWVGSGGYIEVDDFYSNTKAIIEAIRSIDWDNDPNVSTSEMFEERYCKVRFHHNHPERGAKVFKDSFDTETFKLMAESGNKELKFDKELYHKVREQYDREIGVWEKSAKELLAEIDKLI